MYVCLCPCVRVCIYIARRRRRRRRRRPPPPARPVDRDTLDADSFIMYKRYIANEQRRSACSSNSPSSLQLGWMLTEPSSGLDAVTALTDRTDSLFAPVSACSAGHDVGFHRHHVVAQARSRHVIYRETHSEIHASFPLLRVACRTAGPPRASSPVNHASRSRVSPKVVGRSRAELGRLSSEPGCLAFFRPLGEREVYL